MTSVLCGAVLVQDLHMVGQGSAKRGLCSADLQTKKLTYEIIDLTRCFLVETSKFVLCSFYLCHSKQTITFI